MFYNVITLVFVIHCAFISLATTCKCFSTDDDHYKCHFSTRTPYRYIANYNDSKINYPGCTEKKIWLMIRHGTRFPGKKDSSQMIEELPKLRQLILDRYECNESKISEQAYHDLAKWRLDLIKADTMKLTEEGERELIDLAERIQSRFHTLLPEIYNNSTYKLKYTHTQRAEESAKHFTIGLFGQSAAQKVWYHPAEHNDIVLRSYKNCDRWKSEVKHNPKSTEQMRMFINSNVFNETLDEMSQVLGFVVDYDTAYLIYLTCGFETAWKKDANSPWCRFLSLSNFQVIEYARDLSYFWNDGYGFELNHRQACPGLRDVFQFFQAESELKAAIHFSHSGTILKLASLLGLAKDATKLRHDSFQLHQNHRAWRVSRIDAFASNIGFVLYECQRDGPSILTMHQERVVQIPGCPENGPCPISIFEKIFSQSINHCDFKKICTL
ncbi:multiple inositol polyphosphate phosphatase 1-like isoform X1 [Neodiprion fabricii]|uniref:multiple inositol polyphosphate phosphatase 1-like isoform X1 n=2 Tax=Neodiprion fabricii TaxID=2872261 RepID=UPI001ED936C6|nr:multiple inositol polyphosphate phosphatase 1-like isoform X1 [Neodiprion fabricii]